MTIVVPFVPTSDTSKQSASSLRRDRVLTARDAVFHALVFHGPSTDEEICTHTRLGPSTERPRRIELVEQGRVRDSGDRRKTASGRRAVVWETCEPGAKQLSFL